MNNPRNKRRRRESMTKAEMDLLIREVNIPMYNILL